jgi:pimeloyl-ACP methyl ester carboxylesterase
MTKRESVILLHGLARSSHCMSRMENTLQHGGYHTVNLNYPSTSGSIESLSDSVITEALAQTEPSETVHFVTHSLGGILLRYFLTQNEIAGLGRVVMLAPPNHGSQIVEWLQHYRLFQRLLGPAASQLGTRPDSLVNQLPPAPCELGIIAGSRAVNLLFSPFLPKPNDGTVSVENTKLAGMRDHITLPTTHPLIMRNKQVIQQVLAFLKSGQFSH